MKYKRRIVTGAIALSLLIGSPTFAVSVEGAHAVRASEQATRRQSIHKKKGHHIVGVVTGISGSVFTLQTHAGKKSINAGKALSADIHTGVDTGFEKNGLKAILSDIQVGHKVIVNGVVDIHSQTIHAKKVKIITN